MTDAKKPEGPRRTVEPVPDDRDEEGLDPIQPGPEPDTSTAVRAAELPDEVDTDAPAAIIDEGDEGVEPLEP